MSGLQNGSDPSRADFDWRGFARALRAAIKAADVALRPLARAAGVTTNDISRASSGQMVSVSKVIALCDFFGFDLRGFYLAPEIEAKNSATKTTRSTCRDVKQERAAA